MYTLLKLIVIVVLILHESHSKHMKPPRSISNVGDESKDLPEISMDAAPDESIEPPETIERRRKRSSSLRDSLTAAFSSLAQDNDDEKDSTDALGDTDLKSLFVKYDTDDGNTCLLDTIKQDILWWTFPNGTLKVTNARYCK